MREGWATGGSRGRTRRVLVAVVFLLIASAVVALALLGPKLGYDMLTARSVPRVKNVLIFLVDTLRADHLGCYGYARDTSPNIDRFARESARFERAFSLSPWTRTSVVSLFTSLYPVAHGCQDKDDAAGDALVTMAEIFHANGYRTRGFSSNVSVSREFGLDQGFDDFTYFERESWLAGGTGRIDPGYVPIEGMLPDLLEWLAIPDQRPFFVYFHSTDPHWRYAPPAEFAAWGQNNAVDRYDGEIRYTDHYFGKAIEQLRSLGKLDDTLVIFTADHGEELWDHGRQGHGHTLYNELLEVPLIMRHPSFTPGRLETTVRLTDVLPTLIDLCHLSVTGATIQGHSLAPQLYGKGAASFPEDFVLAEVMYTTKIGAVSLQSEHWKVIWTLEDRFGKQNAWELYDVGIDPREKADLASRENERLRSMAKRLENLRESFKGPQLAPVRPELDPATKEALRRLGYI